MAISAIQEIADAGRKWDSVFASCFDPRHGLSAVLKDGRRIDFVICYDCSEVRLYGDGKEPGSVFFGGTEAHPTPDRLNQLLKDNEIPMSPTPD